MTAFLSGNLIWLVRGRSSSAAASMFWRQAEGKFNQNFHLRIFFPRWRRQFHFGATVDTRKVDLDVLALTEFLRQQEKSDMFKNLVLMCNVFLLTN